MQAAVGGYPDIAIGNVVGSNIANIALVLGVTALILPLPVERDSYRLDWPVMMGATILFAVFVQNLMMDRWEGILSVVALASYLWFLIWKSRRRAPEDVDHSEEVKPHLLRDLGFVVAGCVGLVFGADWLLSGAVDIATNLGVSEWIIGVTVVAFGTSLPELVTSAVAALRKQTDISIGNLIGSNLFNLLAILGLTSVVTPIPVEPKVLTADLWWLLGISALILPFMIFGRKITRIKGVVLVLVYIGYITYVVSGG